MSHKYRQKNRRRQRERRGWTVEQQRERRAADAKMRKMREGYRPSIIGTDFSAYYPLDDKYDLGSSGLKFNTEPDVDHTHQSPADCTPASMQMVEQAAAKAVKKAMRRQTRLHNYDPVNHGA